MSVTVSNSLIQDYVHQYDQTQPTYWMTPGFKPFTEDILQKVTLAFLLQYNVVLEWERIDYTLNLTTKL